MARRHSGLRVRAYVRSSGRGDRASRCGGDGPRAGSTPTMIEVGVIGLALLLIAVGVRALRNRRDLADV